MNANRGIIISGNGKIESDIINVGDNSSINVNASASPEQENIAFLLSALKKSISLIPVEHSEKKETIEHFSSSLENESNKEKSNKTILSITAKGLLDAAEAIKNITPTVFDTAKMIFNFYNSI